MPGWSNQYRVRGEHADKSTRRRQAIAGPDDEPRAQGKCKYQLRSVIELSNTVGDSLASAFANNVA
jgi:hypothetical protein